jgi:hypothetical protein
LAFARSALARDLRFARRDDLRRLALVDAREHLALRYPVPDVGAQLDDPSGDLRRDRRLAHRLDDTVGGVDLVDVAELDRRGRGLREGCGERRRGEGEK